MYPVVLLAAGVAVAIVVYRTLRQYYALKEFGGPWSVGFTRLWLLWANGCGKMNLVFTEVNDKYGMYEVLLQLGVLESGRLCAFPHQTRRKLDGVVDP